MIASRSSKILLPIFLLAALTAVPALFLLQIPTIGSSTEAREAQVIDSIQRTGEWILPLRNGIIPSKPPLYHWLSAGIAEITGHEGMWINRIVSLLSGAGLVFVTGALTAIMFGSTPAGLLSGAILSLTIGFTSLALQCRVDMLFAFLVNLALFFVLRRFRVGYLQDARGLIPLKSGDMTLFYCCSGLAVLSRGPLGIVLPLLILFAVLAYIAGLRAAIRQLLKPDPGWLLFALIAVPWYWLAYQKGGDPFLARHLFFENLERFSGGEYVNYEVPWFYVPSLLKSTFPWSLLAVWFGWKCLRDRLRGPRRLDACQDNYHRIEMIPLVWLVAGVFFFSLASGKRHAYLLPLFPAVSVFVAVNLSRWREALDSSTWSAYRKMVSLYLPISFLTVAVAGLEAARLPVGFGDSAVLQARLWISHYAQGLQLVLVAVLLLVLLKRNCVTAWFACYLLLICSLIAGAGIKNHFKGFDSIAIRVNTDSHTSPIQVVKHERDEYFDVVLYYLHRDVRIVPDAIVSRDILCGGVTLAHAQWYAEHKVELNLKEMNRYRPMYDEIRGKSDREIVLFCCG